MGGKSKKDKKRARAAEAAANQQIAEMRQQTAVVQAQVEGERRELGEQEAGRRRLRRGGQRALLSSARMDAESGIPSLGSDQRL
jgi:hypothetical protein